MEKHPLLSWRFHCSAWSFVLVANYFLVSSLSQWAILSQIQSLGVLVGLVLLKDESHPGGNSGSQKKAQ